MLNPWAVADTHSPSITALSFSTRSHTRRGNPSPRGAELVTLGGSTVHGGPAAVAVAAPAAKHAHVDLDGDGDEDAFRVSPKGRGGCPDDGDVGFWREEAEEPSDDESTDKRMGRAV